MSRNRTAHVAFLVAALLATTLVAALGGLSVARKVAAFQPLGFTAAAGGSGWQVAEVTHPRTGLLAGDLILTVQGREPATFEELHAELRDRGESQLLVGREGDLAAVTYARPPVDVDFPFLILALVGAAYLLIGFYTLVKDGRGNGRLFFCWCLASAALYLFTQGPRFDEAGKVLFVGDMLARLLLPPLTLHLFLTFPRFLRRDGSLRRAMPFLYLPAAFLLAVQVDLIAQGGSWLSASFAGVEMTSVLALLDGIELAHLAFFVLASIAVLAVRLRRSRNWEEHRQLRWIALGVAGGYLPFLAIYAAPRVAGVEWSEMVIATAVVPLALVPLTFAYAILRYKLWDIEVMVRDAISYTLTLLVGVIGFSLANLALDRGLPEDVPLLRNVLVFVAGLAIAGVLVPAKRGISTGLELLQYRGTFGKRRALAGIGRELLHERDLNRLCNRLLEAMEEAVDLERANLLLVRGSMLTAVRPETGLPPLPAASLGEAVWNEEIGRLGGVGLGEPTSLPAQRLYAAGYRYALPLTVQGVPVGLALVGWKLDQERLTSDDVSLLRQLLDQAALAIENARLVDQLQTQLDEVSRLQQYNERIIESSPAGIAVIDGEDRIVSANQGFAQLVGHRRDELPGVPLESVLPIRPIPEPGNGPLDVALCEVGDQRERYFQVSAAPFDRPAGGRILVIHDVTDQRAMEAALKERDRLAALGVMAAGVAHEVNTPLTGISSYAQMLLAETPHDDPRHDVLRKVERQTFRAAKIVNNLLDFARNRSAGDESGPVDLVAVVDDCLDLLRERLSKRGVRVRWRRPEEGEARARGDAGELQQVVTNLLLNACDAMPQGGDLSLRLAADGDRLRLTVADSGEGIPAGDLERIFEPFFTTKLGRGGTGLGLAISADIVRHHGGTLSAANGPDGGAVFTLDLPREGTGAGAAAAGR